MRLSTRRIMISGLFLLFGAYSLASATDRMKHQVTASGPIVCAPASSSLARSFREGIEWLLSSSDSIAIESRQRWGIPITAPEGIVAETDSTTCRRGFDAYRAAWAGTDSMAERTIVLSFRDRRAILVEPSDFYSRPRTGHWPTLVTDTAFNAIVLHW